MRVKNLTVGKGLQAYRLYSQASSAPSMSRDNPGLNSDEVHRIFYDRLMSASEKVAQRTATPCTPVEPTK